MASHICTVFETSYSTESNRKGMNILVVKGTAHTGKKEIHAKFTAITLASFDIGCFKKSLEEEDEEEKEQIDNSAVS